MFDAPAHQTKARSARDLASLALALGACLIGCQAASGPRSGAADAGAANPAVPPVASGPPELLSPGDEIELFDGTTLGQWKAESIGASDAVRVEQGALELRWGSPGTSVVWTGTRIPANYELALDVMESEGSGSGYWFLTFPFDGERTCTLTLSNGMGWLCGGAGAEGGGALTRKFVLEPGAWHRVRLRVVGGRIEAFLDDEELVAEPAASSPTAVSERPSDPSLEIATWAMTASVRDIRLKRLPDGAR